MGPYEALQLTNPQQQLQKKMAAAKAAQAQAGKEEDHWENYASSLLPNKRKCEEAQAFLLQHCHSGSDLFQRICNHNVATCDVPVLCLRWTHNGVNKKFTDASKDIFTTAEEIFVAGHKYWQKQVTIPALEVVLTEDGKLWSISNRRLAAFSMAQSLMSETLEVRCKIFKCHPKFSPNCSLTTTNLGIGIRPNRQVVRPQRPKLPTDTKCAALMN